MLTVADIMLVAFLVVVWPLYEYRVDVPRFHRWLREMPGRARLLEYRLVLVTQWVLTAAVVVVWLRSGRSWSDIGIVAVEGWRLWVGLGLAAAVLALHGVQTAALARSEKARAEARNSRSVQAVEFVCPHDNAELAWFLAVSVTAGICEELLFRGYLISVLAPWLGWWPAAAVAVVPFGLMHSYQGRRGVIQTTLVGIGMTVVVWLTQSLIPAMAIHAAVDIGGGLVTWTILRERPGVPAPAAEP